jgi:hypothetical protein
MSYKLTLPAVLTALLAAIGCNNAKAPPTGTAETKVTAKAKAADAESDEIAAELAKLSPEDRKLAEAQKWCAISSNERLGEMGPPIKITLKGQPVFLCCEGCQKKAEANPDKTLAKVEELKAKAKAEAGAKK